MYIDLSKRSKSHLTVVAFLYMLCFSVQAADSYFFYIQFKDKNHTPYTLNHPENYLSTRAIQRRMAQQIAIDSTDLPVNRVYMQTITSKGARIYNQSKWMNGVTVLVSDSSVMSEIRRLAFVAFAEYTGKRSTTASAVKMRSNTSVQSLNYGIATTQTTLVHGNYLHDMGYTGNDIVVAILDAGFLNANTIAAFDSLRIQGRLLGTKDVAEAGANVYALDAHGTNVLSVLTGNIPGQFLGVAPKASYWLIRTEYAPTEYPVEADFWCTGVEFADSVGADVVNSSLGYSTFDDASLNYNYQNLNGRTYRVSRAATMAARKGIVVCNSAGNEGNKTWHYITTPADADSIITVGAVTSSGVASYFTSYGPAADGRIKPDICAMGSADAVVDYTGATAYYNGTSFSSPVTAGLVACLIQANKDRHQNYNAVTIRNALIRSGSQWLNPTAQTGYGIANFETAYKTLFTDTNTPYSIPAPEISYTAANKHLRIMLPSVSIANKYRCRLVNMQGCTMAEWSINSIGFETDTHFLNAGIYCLLISGNNYSYSQKICLF